MIDPGCLFDNGRWAVGLEPLTFPSQRVTCRVNYRKEDIQRVVCREKWQYQRLSCSLCQTGVNCDFSSNCRLEPVYSGGLTHTLSLMVTFLFCNSLLISKIMSVSLCIAVISMLIMKES